MLTIPNISDMHYRLWSGKPSSQSYGARGMRNHPRDVRPASESVHQVSICRLYFTFFANVIAHVQATLVKSAD